MAQSRKKRSQKISAQRDALPSKRKTGSTNRTPIAVAVVVVLVIAIVGGIFFYQSNIAPFRRPVMSVDTSVIRMGYFLKRTRLAGLAPQTMVQQITIEEIVTERALELGLDVTPSEIDDALLFKSSTENITTVTTNLTARYLTESEFKAWYRQQLSGTGFSDAEYRDMTRANLLVAKLQQSLAKSIPTVGEQVHLNMILVSSSAEADKAKTRIRAGESFTSVARDVSLDTQSRNNGGDVGWTPRGVLPYDQIIFGLGIGDVSESVPTNSLSTDNGQYLLFMVSEKTFSQQIDDAAMQKLKSRALLNWLTREMPSHTVKYDILNFDLETLNWMNYQLVKATK